MTKDLLTNYDQTSARFTQMSDDPTTPYVDVIANLTEILGIYKDFFTEISNGNNNS